MKHIKYIVEGAMCLPHIIHFLLTCFVVVMLGDSLILGGVWVIFFMFYFHSLGKAKKT